MGKKNNFAGRYIYHEELEKIIAKAVKAENEACAQICEGMLFEDWTDADRQVLCADAIRARIK